MKTTIFLTSLLVTASLFSSMPQNTYKQDYSAPTCAQQSYYSHKMVKPLAQNPRQPKISFVEAVQHNNTFIVNMFLNHRVNPNAKDEKNKHALCFALENKNLEMVELLLSHGATPENIDPFNRSALHYAVKTGSIKVVHLVLVHQAEIDAQDKTKRTPLHYTATENYDDIATLLLENHANPNTEDGRGRTPLGWAASRGNTEVVTKLLENGADPNKTTHNGVTPLSWACSGGHYNVAKILLEYTNPNCSDTIGLTPLHWACKEKHTDIIKLLLEYGANPNSHAFGNKDKTLLYYAIENGKFLLAKSLILHGATVFNQSLLHPFVAATIHLQQRGHYKKDCKKSALKLAQLLILFGANPEQLENEKTAAQKAEEAGLSELAQLVSTPQQNYSLF